MRQIIRVIRHFLREKRWWHLPRYTFGSSSGGVIALELPLRFPFQVLPAGPPAATRSCLWQQSFPIPAGHFIISIQLFSAAASSCRGPGMRCRAAVLKVTTSSLLQVEPLLPAWPLPGRVSRGPGYCCAFRLGAAHRLRTGRAV